MGCKVTKNITTSIQYIERIFVRWRGSRISGEKLLINILKKGGGPLPERSFSYGRLAAEEPEKSLKGPSDDTSSGVRDCVGTALHLELS